MKNDGNLTITDITVTDERTGFETQIESLEPGESKEFTTSTTVTEEDILSGHILNEATAEGTSPDPDEPEVPVDPGTTDDEPEEPAPKITVTKTVTTEPEDENGYVIYETVGYKIVVKNEGNLTVKNIAVTDELTNDSWTIDSLEPGESKAYTAEYEVQATDVAATSVTNEVTAEGTASNDAEVSDDDDVTVDTTTIAIEITAASDSKEYDGTPLTNSGYEQTDGELVGGDAIDSVTVTGSQTYVGSSDNVPSAAVIKNGETDVTAAYDITYVPGKLTVTKSTKDFTITSADGEWVYDGESHTAFEYTVKYGDDFEETVKIGEDETSATVTLPTGDVVTITPDDTAKITNARESDVDNSFTFTVKNGEKDTSDQFETITPVDGKLTVTKKDLTISVGDTSVKYDGEEHEGFGQKIGREEEDVQFDGLVDGQIGTVTYDPAVGTLVGEYEGSFTEESLLIVVPATIQSGSIRGMKLSKAEALEGEDVTDNYNVTYDTGLLDITDEDEDGPVDPSLVVTKEVDDKKYELGEEIEFTVTATNIYKDAKTITLTEIDGVTLDKSVFENVEGGKTVTTTARYTVKEADILKGEFTNTVKASFNDGIEAEAEATANTADKNAHMTVEKECTSEPENGETYALGEKITWKITVTNDGNVTIKNVTVTDELTGDEWTVKTLAPGESKEFTAEYTVTEDDILAGSVKNEATASGEDPDGDEPDVDPGDDEEPTDPKNSHLTVEKVATSEPKNGTGYAEGEKITWKITVTNDGNMTIKNVTVTDELTGDEWTIEALEPGESKEFEAEYTVTADDVKEGSVVNTATATGEDPDGDEPGSDPGTDEEKTDNPKAHLTIKKVATSTPKNGEKYDAGETITWKITVVNDGEVEVTNIEVEDKLTGDKWTIDSLQPGESKEFTAEYTVTEADKQAGKVVNVATGTGEVPGGGTPSVTPGKDEQPVIPVETVKTGDDTNMWLWTILMAASTVSMGAIMLTAKKRRFEEE